LASPKRVTFIAKKRETIEKRGPQSEYPHIHHLNGSL